MNVFEGRAVPCADNVGDLVYCSNLGKMLKPQRLAVPLRITNYCSNLGKMLKPQLKRINGLVRINMLANKIKI